MSTYQGISLSDDQLEGARIRLRKRVQQAIQDMQCSSYDPGTIAYLLADLEALSRFDGSGMQNGSDAEEAARPVRAARRGH